MKIKIIETQLSFFHESEYLKKISAMGDPLEKLLDLFNFEDFRPTLMDALQSAAEKSQKPPIESEENSEKRNRGGRPRYDPVLMFKAIIVKSIRRVSDEGLEFTITDSLSVRRFLNISSIIDIPDRTTFWNFQQEFMELDGVKKVFNYLLDRLKVLELVGGRNLAMDSQIIPVEIQRNSFEENALLKNGVVPEDWEDEPEKRSQKDVDAKWTKKRGESYFGYKNHTKIDADSKLIENYHVTPASIHDGTVVPCLLEESDVNRNGYGDTHYNIEASRIEMERRGVINRVNELVPNRNTPEGIEAAARNSARSTIRSSVEHVYARSNQLCGSTPISVVGVERVGFQIGMRNLIYNMFRMITLKVQKVDLDAASELLLSQFGSKA